MSDARGLYSISETIFASGAWLVARAADADGRPVRLTTLQLPPGMSGEELERVASAMDSAAARRAASPGLLPILAGGLADGELWLAESAPNGPSVRESIAASGPMEADRVVPFLHQVAAALEPMHAAGLAHTWLSPDNVFLEPTALVGGQPWAGILPLLRQASPAAGWPEADYVAPEALSAPSNGTRAEVYSAAALAAFATTGKAPSASHLSGLAPALRDALSRGLQPEPNARYRDVKEMAVDVTVEQAIAMQDAADRTTVPAGGDVPDWARDLLQETATRRDAGQPLVDTAPTAPEPPAPQAAPAPRPSGAVQYIPAPRVPDAVAAPPEEQRHERPERRERTERTDHFERPGRTVEPVAPGFNWSENERPRSLIPTLMAVLSALFIIAAIALTFIKK